MKYIHRTLEKSLSDAAKGFPAVVLTGPRRAGKTWLLKHLYPYAEYVLLEDPDVVARVRNDPHGFLDSVQTPVILDEIQVLPELFAYIRARIDKNPRKCGQWLLTGSQEAPLMQNVSESMSGRAAILQLWPLSTAESPGVSLLKGGYPEVLARSKQAALWFASYVQTYLERDVRAITAVKDLATFRRFFALVASRHGQMLNKTSFAAPLGISVPTITQWLSVLEISGQILIVPPFYENLGKRLVKSPKIYLTDSGLACHLLGIGSEAELERSPFRGALFEGFVAAEIVKRQIHAGRRRELYYFRDEQGLEVDFVIPRQGGNVGLVECKAGKTVFPDMANPMLQLGLAFEKTHKRQVEGFLVYQSSRPGAITAVAPGVRALPCRDFFAIV